MEGFFHHIGQIARILDQEVVLHDGARDAHGIAFLEGIQANSGRRHLAGHDHHRNAVHIGGGDAGHGIRHTRPRSHQSHPYIARGARIAIGGMHCRLFVTHQNVLDGVLLVERVIDVQDGPTWIAPDVLDAFGLQGLDNDFGSPELLMVPRRSDGFGSCRYLGGRSDFSF